MMDDSDRRRIIVTGFGPFANHNVNASWQAVKQLSKSSSEELKRRYNINLIIEEIPVVYHHVIDCIPKLWKQHNPIFVIHVGVSHMASCLTIEKKAHNIGYIKEDICKKCPQQENDNDNCIVALETEIDIDNLCNIVNQSGICTSSISNNAGRYLCEYTYYQSLCIKKNQTLFIHVPIEKICPIDVTARGLFFIICYLIENNSIN